MATTSAELSGLFKEVYGDSPNNLIPDAAKIVKMVKFVPGDKETGNLYHQPVVVSFEHGVTYAATSDGAFTLKAAVPMKMQDAQIGGSPMVLRTSLSYEAASKASSGGKKAFAKATDLIVRNMLESITKRVEIADIYGSTGLGQTSSSVNTDTTHTVLQVSTATWATGIWAGMQTAKVNFYKVSDGTLVSSAADAIFNIDSVDVTNRKLTVSGTTTGISALDTAAAAGALNIYFDGANGKEMSGIDKIVTNSGTLFNISATTYNLWKGNSYDVQSSALTFGKIQNAVALSVQQGLDEDVDCFLNPNTWASIATDQAALRRLDGSYERRKTENGAESIAFYGQNGTITIHSHNIIKEGEAFILPLRLCKRVGSQDISFNTPGREGEIFTQLADAAGFELRVYTDQAFFIEYPARCVKLINIVNPT